MAIERLQGWGSLDVVCVIVQCCESPFSPSPSQTQHSIYSNDYSEKLCIDR